jgi:hypothetical protein
MRHFCEQRFFIPRIGNGIAHMRVEIAIRAARQAEGPMDIEREHNLFSTFDVILNLALAE